MMSRCAVAGVLLTACAADRTLMESSAGASADESSDDMAVDPSDPPPLTSADAEDDSGGAPDPRPGPDAPYPYCEYNGADYEEFCPPTTNFHGYSTWYVEGDSSRFCDLDDCNACLCGVSCKDPSTHEEDPANCPVPPSGTAQPECFFDLALCFLTCDDTETCPDGMSCVHNLEIERFVCAWVRE